MWNSIVENAMLQSGNEMEEEGRRVQQLENPLEIVKSDVLTFTLNGEKRNVDTRDITPEMTLNGYIRSKLHLTGTKFMCLEGGCGSCVVVVTIRNPRTMVKGTHAVNSCLVALLSCQNWEIQTVEYLGNQYDGLHKIQEQIVKFNGTQCGFCTPGMVMNMYALQENDQTKMAEIENSFGGNLCRCTGYRAILTAFKAMASDADESILGIIPDIEELKLCSKNKNKVCKQQCHLGSGATNCTDGTMPLEMSLHTTSNQNWYKVQTTREIFALFRSNRQRTYQLVAGNTARGVYRDMAQREYFIDITAVKELRDYEWNTKNLKLGGNMTLTEVMDVFKDIASKDDGFKYLNKVVEHIDLIAHIPVRNIGTLAGNLSIKKEHKEFPSDIFVLLEVIGANIVIDNGLRKLAMSPQRYLDYDMNQKIIHSIELPPLDRRYRLETYKIMPRAQNTHAYLNAGFLISINGNNVVDSASFVFGGVAPDFIHAENSEKLITGKFPFDNCNIQKLFAQLYAEVNPVKQLPDPSPEFKKQVTVALMYKFILSIAPESLITKQNRSGGKKLVRPSVSTGVQHYKTNESLYPVGQPIGKLEAKIQSTGEAEYIVDMPDLHNQCFAAFVMGRASPGSVLKEIDASKALRMEGVEAFLQASDIADLGGVNSHTAPGSFYGEEDEEVFLTIGEPIKFYYQPVGAIVARSSGLAERAAAIVNVTFAPSYYSPILTTKEAIESDKDSKGEKHVHHLHAFLAKYQSPITEGKSFKGVMDTGAKYHYYMEPQVTNVVPKDDGSFDIHAATQWMDGVQYSIQRSLNIPAHKLRISVPRVGGAFGGKLTQNNFVSIVATLAAMKLRKPVKFTVPLIDNMNVMGKRNAHRSEYEVSVTDDGEILSLKNSIYNNQGNVLNTRYDDYLLLCYTGVYKTDRFETDIHDVKSDIPAATTFRGPGSMEGVVILETVLEHIAYQVDKDPIDVRLKNLQDVPLLKKLIDDCLQMSDYRNRRAAIEVFNNENRWRKKGISLIPMTFGLIFIGPYHVQVSAFHADGTVAISHSGVDIGQGINTKTAQAAAYLLNIPMSMIQIWPSNNFVSPNATATGSSLTTECVIMALKVACTNLLTRINKAAETSNLPADTPWADKVKNAFNVGVSLTENQGFFYDPASDSIQYNVYGVAVSEVEVDILTGQHIVTRVDIVEDTGDSLNPAIDIGQVEGAFVMGMGHWTVENLIYNEEGALMTNNTWTYKIPGARDIPVDFRVKLPDGIPNPVTPFRNKATTEPPICLAYTVPLAIKHALKSARLQSDKGADPWATMESPATIDWIFMNALNDFKQYTF